MGGSYFKHIHEQSNHDHNHGGKLFWGGGIAGGNVPYRGPYAPMLTRDELDTDVGIVKDFYHRTFNLADPEDSLDYDWVMDRISNGWFQRVHIERKMVDGKDGPAVFVYLEWVQRYGELSPAARSARKQGDVYSYPKSNASAVPLAGVQPANSGF